MEIVAQNWQLKYDLQMLNAESLWFLTDVVVLLKTAKRTAVSDYFLTDV